MSLGKTPIEDLRPFMACCCAVTSCYLACPECCGVFCKGTCCCCSCDEVCCKCLNPSENEEKKFCICSEGRATCLHPKTCCLMQEQCFCLDSRCAFPCTKDVPCMTNLCCINCCAGWKCACGFMKSVGGLIEGLKSEPVPVSPKGKAEGGDFLSGTGKAQEATDVDIGQLRSCMACCCCLSSAYCEFPKCCGAKMAGTCCCIQQEQACCVPLCMNDTGDEKLCCVFQEGGCYGVCPRTCCFGQNQCCCCDTRFAFPCVAQVPCLFGCLGCVCNKKCKGACCKLNKDLVYDQE